MKTIKCPNCGLVAWENVIVCNRCESELSAVEPIKTAIKEEEFFADEQVNEHESAADNEAFEHQEQMEEFAQDFQAYDPTDESTSESQDSFRDREYNRRQFSQAVESKPKLKIAIASMVLGILSFPAFWVVWAGILAGFLAVFAGLSGGLIGGVIAFTVIPLSIILGIVALVKCKKHPQQFGGKPFAITGIVCGSLGILTLPIILAIAIPNFLAARSTAIEATAVNSIQKIAEAQAKFRQTTGGRCGTLKELHGQNMIDVVLGNGEKMGYRYLIIAIPSVQGGCEILATPKSKSVARTSFYYSTEDGILRGEDKNGQLADKTSPKFEGFSRRSRVNISSREFDR